MSDNLFDELQQIASDAGPAAAIDKLIEIEREGKQYHKLFDALLMKKKCDLGLPVTRPTSFDDVPTEKRKDFEEAYIAAAREAGQLLLDEGNIPQAWIYFRTINDSEPVRDAIEARLSELPQHPQYDEILNVALYEGASPLSGIRLMLQSHGTCNTITSLDQMMQHLSPEQRADAAAIMVKHLYGELQNSLQYSVQQRIPVVPPGASIRELCQGRDWLFEEGNYHIDVSHLNAVVRFARSLRNDAEELPLAIELAEYGSKLDPKLQYEGDPPFQDFYPAHIHFLKVLAGQDVDAGFAYFEQKLNEEPDEPDQQLIAYVMTDLYIRTDRLDDAVALAGKYLQNVEDPSGFSFAELCREAGKVDVLQSAARETHDPLRFTAALVTASQSASAT